MERNLPLEMTLACKWAFVIHVQEKSSLFINSTIKMLFSFGEVLYLCKKYCWSVLDKICQVVKSKGDFNLQIVVTTI
jgi:hypothetical protein